MDTQALTKISKRLSYVLRHRPDTVGIVLGDGGWIGVDDLLAALAGNGHTVSRSVLDRVVAENDKQRFEYSEDGLRLRARQGHSTEVDLGYAPATPPDVLYHGTATRNLESILVQGLVKARRHHVHLSTNRETMIQVAMRHGEPVLLIVDTLRMYKDGYRFFVTGNDVWLTEHVPPAYLAVVSS